MSCDSCKSREKIYTYRQEDRYILNTKKTGWWFGCHLDYFPIHIGFIIIPIDGPYFSEGWPWPTTRQVMKEVIQREDFGGGAAPLGRHGDTGTDRDTGTMCCGGDVWKMCKEWNHTSHQDPQGRKAMVDCGAKVFVTTGGHICEE